MAQIELFDRKFIEDNEFEDPKTDLKIPHIKHEDENIAIVLAPSHRTPGKWHRIIIDKTTDPHTYICQNCKGFEFKGKCIDINILKWFGQIKRKQKRTKGVQETSKEAFMSLSVEDLSDRRRKVFNALKSLGKGADWELQKVLHWPINTITPRRGELVDLGYIEQSGFNQNPDTKKTVMVWKSLL